MLGQVMPRTVGFSASSNPRSCVLLSPDRSSHGRLRQQLAMGQASVQSYPDGARGPPAPALSVFPVSRDRGRQGSREGEAPVDLLSQIGGSVRGNLGRLDWGRNHAPGFRGKEGVPCCDRAR